MADLKTVCDNLGWASVTIYIQSGNLIFISDKSHAVLESELEEAIAKKFGFEVAVVVRSPENLQNAVDKNPFSHEHADSTQLHLTFLKETPTIENVAITTTYNYGPDEFKIDGKDVFIRCASKYHQSKLSNSFFEKKLKTAATTRNWKTVLKLIELSR